MDCNGLPHDPLNTGNLKLQDGFVFTVGFLINPLHIENHNATEVGLRLQNKLEALPISRSCKGVLDTVKYKSPSISQRAFVKL